MLRSRMSLTVLEICYFPGLDDIAHSSRYFKRVIGISPRLFSEQEWASEPSRAIIERERCAALIGAFYTHWATMRIAALMPSRAEEVIPPA